MNQETSAERLEEETTPVAEVEETVTTDDSNEFAALADDMLDEELAEEVENVRDESDRGDEVPNSTMEDDGTLPVAEETTEVVETTEDEQKPAAGEVETKPAEETAETTQTEEQETVAEETKPEDTEESEVKSSEPETEQEEVDFVALRQEALQSVTDRYMISEEDTIALASEPEKVLPKLAAQIYLDAFENITQGIISVIPRMIENQMETKRVSDANTAEFYGKWEGKLDMNNPKHHETVSRIANVYAQVNPDSNRERFIAEVGAQALMALGIPFEQIIDDPEPEPKPKPFTPAKPGGIPARQGKPTTNEWGELAEDFIVEDNSE